MSITRILLATILFLLSPVIWATPITAYLEMVKVSSVGYNWKTVPLTNSYIDPVIACTYNLPSIADNEAAVRIQKVGTGFQVKVQRPADSSAVTASDVYCTISESGSYTYPIKYEAHTISSAGTNYQSDWTAATMENVSAAPYKVQSYSNPVVIGQVMSYENPSFSVFWSNGCGSRNGAPTDAAICVGKHTGQSIPDTPNAETLGYFIAEEGEYLMANAFVKIAEGADSVAGAANAAPYQYTLPRSYTYATASQMAEDGGNGGWAVLYGSNPVSTTLNLAIEEETIRGDTSRTHTLESVGYWVMEPIVTTHADLIINEVLYQQATGQPEFVELYAMTSGSIVNYVVSSQDLISQNYYLPDLTVNTGDYIILYSGTGTNSSSGNVHYVYTQSTTTPLANTGDDVVLLKPSATDVTVLNGSGTVNAVPVDYMAYGTGSSVDPVPTSVLGVTVSWDASQNSRLGGASAGTSVSLTPNATDTDSSVCWEITTSGDASACPGFIVSANTDSSGFVNSLGQHNNYAPILTLEKSVSTIFDPFNGASNPKAIPGSVLEYTITASNSGPAPADNNTIRISDIVPAKTKVCVENSGYCVVPYLVDGTVSSGLSIGTTVYSDNGGSSYSYSPLGDGDGADSSVTHLSVPTTGQFQPISGTIPSSFSIKFRVVVE